MSQPVSICWLVRAVFDESKQKDFVEVMARNMVAGHFTVIDCKHENNCACKLENKKAEAKLAKLDRKVQERVAELRAAKKKR